MAGAYSISIIEVQGLTGVHPAYAVPAGHVLVVRHVSLYVGQGLSTYEVRVKDLTVGQTFWAAFGTTINNPDFRPYDMRVVIPEGHLVEAISGGHPVDLTVSGYLLTS